MSQTDRATAAWVSFGQNITGRGYSALNLIGLSSTIVTRLASESIKFGEITQNKSYYAVQDHSRSLILVPI